MPTYSPGVQLAWQIGATEASETHHEFIEREHILIGLCRLEDAAASPAAAEFMAKEGVAAYLQAEAAQVRTCFEALSIDRKKMMAKLRSLIGAGGYTPDNPNDPIHRSPACRDAFRRSEDLSRAAGAAVVHAMHLFAGVVDTAGPRIAQALVAAGGDLEKLQRHTHERMNPPELAVQQAPGAGKKSVLQAFGTDLVQLARDGKIDPLIGRKKELLKVTRTLLRREKGNPLIIGEAGVGKTAIVRGLAKRIADGAIAEELRSIRIIEVSVAQLVGGTKYRGEFEERVSHLIADVKADKNIVLFLDEIHMLVGAGAGSGAIDAADALKPVLASGEIRCIGATTIAEYRKHIERDPALARRFQPIIVEEPTAEETIAIVEGMRESYERHHHVAIEPAAVRAAVELSVRYLPDRRLPDKALDLIDEACTHIKMGSVTISGDAASAKLGSITPATIAKIISEWTGIPATRLTTDDREQLQRIASSLKRRVIGQDEAVEKLAAAITMGRAGLRDARRPVGVFLFLGGTGVGKTELCKALASVLFGSDRDLIRLDMSEYSERHTIARLIGAPPGYIGHDEEGQITGRLRQKPYSVVLLDEIEKAHRDVTQVFLQLFDDGRLTDSHGRTVDGKHAVYIMTSNAYTEAPAAAIGFTHIAAAEEEAHAGREAVRQALLEKFAPEFVNRIDDVIVFKPLDMGAVKRISRKLLDELAERALEQQHVVLEVADEAIDLVAAAGFDPANGARPLVRAVDRLVGRPLGEALIQGRVQPGDTVLVAVKNRRIVFKSGDSEVTIQ